jgi:ribosomal protein S13
MVRILGNNLSNKKKIYIALTAIYGVGINTSKKILNQLNISSLIILVGVAFEIQKTLKALYKNVLETID